MDMDGTLKLTAQEKADLLSTLDKEAERVFYGLVKSEYKNALKTGNPEKMFEAKVDYVYVRKIGWLMEIIKSFQTIPNYTEEDLEDVSLDEEEF